MELLSELEDICDQMASIHKELAMVQQAETRGRIEHQMHSEERTVTGREQYANFQVIDLTEDRIKLQGELNALRERQKFLMTAIEVYHGSRESRMGGIQ